MIKVNKYITEAYDHYDSEGKYIGTLNEYEHLDLRIQIAEQNIDGYSLDFNGTRFKINNRGDIVDRPLGLYDKLGGLYRKMVKARFSQKNFELDQKEPEKETRTFQDVLLEHLKWWFNYGREVNLNPKYREQYNKTRHLIEALDGPQH
jgi:hypothetical protein